MLTEYRQRFSDFHTELGREEYLFRAGHKTQFEKARILSDYSDLFARARVAELRAILEATATYRETERSAIQLLIAFASRGFLQSRVRELSQEISAYEAQATLRWDEEEISFHQSAIALANEASPARRRELYARRAEVIKATQDLRAERLARLQEAARELGYENYLAAYRELHGLDYEELAARSSSLLSQTEGQYVSALAQLLEQDAQLPLEQATQADLPYLRRLTQFDQFFPREWLRGVYRETLAGLGIRTDKQEQIEIDDEPRPQKDSRAFCIPIRIPDEIKLVINPVGGQLDYQAFFHEAGHAQHFAWTSRHLSPEFQFSGDYAVTETYAFLFNYLLLEAQWLAEMLCFSESSSFLKRLAVHKLMMVRRYAAKLTYEVQLYAGKLAGTAGVRYAELLSDALRVRYDETEHLADLDDGFYAANYLRAWALETQLRDYLKSKYGSRWWTSRKAGELLIDSWNTGYRYQAEELASLLGLGELSFDWLASELLEQVKSEK